jgi:hypothetical protein
MQCNATHCHGLTQPGQLEDAMRDRDELRALRRHASTTSATATALDEVICVLQLYSLNKACDTKWRFI